MLDRNPHNEPYQVNTPTSPLGRLAVGVIAVGALYFAREVIVPLALAILLSFALGPLVVLLRRWHFGRIPSVIAAVLFAFLVIFGVVALIGGQITHLAENLPQYQSNITNKIHALRGSTAASEIVGRASGMLKERDRQVNVTDRQQGAKHDHRGTA